MFSNRATAANIASENFFEITLISARNWNQTMRMCCRPLQAMEPNQTIDQSTEVQLFIKGNRIFKKDIQVRYVGNRVLYSMYNIHAWNLIKLNRMLDSACHLFVPGLRSISPRNQFLVYFSSPSDISLYSAWNPLTFCKYIPYYST